MTLGAMEDKVNEANELVGRDGIEPPTQGFSVLVPRGDYRTLLARIGRNLAVSLPATRAILPDTPHSRLIVLTQD